MVIFNVDLGVRITLIKRTILNKENIIQESNNNHNLNSNARCPLFQLKIDEFTFSIKPTIYSVYMDFQNSEIRFSLMFSGFFTNSTLEIICIILQQMPEFTLNKFEE